MKEHWTTNIAIIVLVLIVVIHTISLYSLDKQVRTCEEALIKTLEQFGDVIESVNINAESIIVLEKYALKMSGEENENR